MPDVSSTQVWLIPAETCFATDFTVTVVFPEAEPPLPSVTVTVIVYVPPVDGAVYVTVAVPEPVTVDGDNVPPVAEKV